MPQTPTQSARETGCIGLKSKGAAGSVLPIKFQTAISPSGADRAQDDERAAADADGRPLLHVELRERPAERYPDAADVRPVGVPLLPAGHDRGERLLRAEAR